jgi:hypothetical protein
MPGDVFCNSNGNIYILVGQECDYMMAEKRKRNNLICELVKAETINIESIKKMENDLKHIYINNFEHENNIYCLKIDYTSRYMIDNEIINLCSFNKTGECKIDLIENLTTEPIELMQYFLIDYHKKLKGYYKSLGEILTVKGINDFFDDFYKKSKLINIKDYKTNGNEISFDLKRLGRLNEWFMLYLNKLFSEYRSRHPYNSLNLSKYEFFDMPGKINDSDINIDNVVCFLPVMKDGYRPENLHKFPWYIPTKTLQLELRKTDKDIKINLDEDYLYVKENLIDIPLTNSKKRLMLKKTKGPGFEITIEGK